MFDPDGAFGLRDVVGPEHGIFADTRWSYDDYKRPNAFRDWQNEMKRRLNSDFFEGIGTYMLDSTTMWTEAIMNDIMFRLGTPGSMPADYDKHWGPQKKAIRKGISDVLKRECNVILTGHLKTIKDRKGVIMKYEYRTTGDLAQYIPALFAETWIMDPRKAGNGIDYRVLTQSTGLKTARSRLAGNGLLDTYEPADMRHILKKAGFPIDNKPWKGMPENWKEL